MITNINGLELIITRKRVKNLTLRVKLGGVYLTAPFRASAGELSAFIASKRSWIERKLAEIKATLQRAPALYRDGETHYIWGAPYTLRVVLSSRNSVELLEGELLLSVANPLFKAKAELLERWCKTRVELVAAGYMREWQEKIGVKAARFTVRKMKSRWGSCSVRSKSIRLSQELVRYPVTCLEYVVIHEICHLIENNHGERFYALLTHYLPDWRERRRRLTVDSE